MAITAKYIIININNYAFTKVRELHASGLEWAF